MKTKTSKQQMKMQFRIFFISSFLFGMLFACGKDEAKIPKIEFITSGGYTYTSDQVIADASVKIGIHASKAETRVSLKKFSILKSENGGEIKEIFSKSLKGSEKENYSYEYNGTVGTESGDTDKLIFKVENKHGQTNEVFVMLTVQ